MVISIAALIVAVIAMLGELALSRRNERMLRDRGALEPPDPVYGTMRWAYPGAFGVMALEGMLRAPDAGMVAAAGALVFVAAKVVKLWAIATLGVRWTYRVLVLPGAPLVTAGPYRFLRHPNYVGVVGELVGMALLTGAVVTGPAATLFFSWLLWRRVDAEERALRLG